MLQPIGPNHLILAALLAFTAAPAHSQAGAADAAAPNYADPATWVCRPGKNSLCTDNLDVLVKTPDGKSTVQHFTPLANPPIDCFYVYPTVGGEDTPYADMRETPQVERVVHVQAGRLSSVCRVFAPIYRQGTMARLKERLAGEKIPNEGTAKHDIEAAWAYYLAHDNHGRGVVLIGHSQGTGALQQLMVAQIDGKPAQSLLVAAFLAGDPSLAVPVENGKSKLVGGTFQHIPLCTAAADTGCAYPWATLLESDPVQTQNFGRPRPDGLLSACVSPAAPSGGPGNPLFIHTKAADAPATDPPFVEYPDQVEGACEARPAGNGFRVHALPGPNQKDIEAIMQASQKVPGWGIHGLDIFMVQGNILQVIQAETKAWLQHHPLHPATPQPLARSPGAPGLASETWV